MKEVFGNFQRWITLSSAPRFAQKEELNIIIEGRNIKFASPIYFNNNRYFLPIRELIIELNGSLSFKEGTLYVKLKNEELTINLNDGLYKAILINNSLYISLADIAMLLKLKTRWNHSANEVAIYFDRERNDALHKIEPGNAALIRFEDVTAGSPYDDEDNLLRLRIMVDYLYGKGIPFHVAWIPRYIDPPNDVDNDLSKNSSIINADFVFTLEYMLKHGGIIGLHGYTHQYGDEVSGDGTEFDERRNNDEKSIRNRIEAAIGTARKLEIPYAFFESPHYASTEFQQSIMEQYFDYIYEPCVGIWGDKVSISPRNKKTRFIPTPLGYVSNEFGIDKMIYRIMTLKEGIIASLFYHPSKEMGFINLTKEEDGYPLFSYSAESPLHRIIDAFEEKKYAPIRIDSIPIL